MCKTLIICSNQMERRVITQVLTSEFDEMKDIFEVSTNDEAYHLLENRGVDLILSDVPHSTVRFSRVVKQARGQNPDVAVVLSTTRGEGEASRAVAKINGDGYLLKPYSPDKLTDIVRKHVIRHKTQSGYTEAEKSEISQRLKDGFREHLFKNCMKIAKEYIDSIYDHEDNKDMIYEKLLGFLEILAELAGEYNLKMKEKILSITGTTRYFLDQYEQRFNAYLIVEKHVRYIFEELDKSYIYVDDVKKVLNYIDLNIRQNITLEDAASHINVSNCYFSKLFKKATSVNFITYTTSEKIDLAKEMLTYTDMPIVNIAYDLSYTETNYFSKSFKKNVGIPPTQFRQENCPVKHSA